MTKPGWLLVRNELGAGCRRITVKRKRLEAQTRPRNNLRCSGVMTTLNWRGSGADAAHFNAVAPWRRGAEVASCRSWPTFFGLVPKQPPQLPDPHLAQSRLVYAPAVACHSPSRHVRTQRRLLGGGRAADAPRSPVPSCRPSGLFRLLHQTEIVRVSAGFRSVWRRTETGCPFLIDSR